MTSVLNLDNEPEFQLGGPAYRLMQRLGLIRPGTPSILRRFVAFLLLTWVPLLILALIEGKALGPTPLESLLLDFATYARFFLAIPLLFLSEVTVGPRLLKAGRQFLDGHFIREEDLPAFAAAVARIRRRREALLPEVVMVGLAGWRAAVDRKAVAGVQAEPFGGRPVYVMPSTSGLNASSRLEDLTAHLASAAALADRA